MEGHSFEEAFRAASDGQEIWHWEDDEWVQYRVIQGVLRTYERKQVVPLTGKLDGWALGECSCVWCTGKLETSVTSAARVDRSDTIHPKDENGRRIFWADIWTGGSIVGLSWRYFPDIWRQSLNVEFNDVRFISEARPGLDLDWTIYTPGSDHSEDPRVLCWRPEEFLDYDTVRKGLYQLSRKAREELRVST